MSLSSEIKLYRIPVTTLKIEYYKHGVLSRTIQIQGTHHYTYKLTELSTGKWYVGSKTKKGKNPLNDQTYWGSSKIVSPLVKANPHNWVKDIIYVGKDAYTMETNILQLCNAATHPMSYNQTNGNLKFSPAGKPAHNKGKSPSEETRQKWSVLRKGKTPPNKGKHAPKITCPHCGKTGGVNNMKRYHFDNCKVINPNNDWSLTIETRAKMSASRKGKPRTEETRKKISDSNKGKTHSEETRQKLREAKLGKKLSEETCKKIGDGNRGKKLSEEHREKLLNANIGKSMSDKNRAKLLEANLGKKHSEEHKQKIAAGNKGKPKPQKTLTCPHCGLTGRDSNITRWHGDNCKHKP